ncbi:MAG TPA: hypothetical protein VIY08_13430 [Candidatus Nitrosocosmicus sp.]
MKLILSFIVLSSTAATTSSMFVFMPSSLWLMDSESVKKNTPLVIIFFIDLLYQS